LSAEEIEIIHHLSTDSGRLSETWLKGELASSGITEEFYIEIVGVICKVLMIDRFAEALGQPAFPIPEPTPGEPQGYRSPGAKMHVSLVETEDVTPEDGYMYGGESWSAGVVQALSLGPDVMCEYWALGDALYIPNADVFDFHYNGHEITRSQIEVVAARVAALHQCVY